MGNLESDEDSLWSRSLRGDGEAFGVLYDRHRDRVFRHAYRLVGNHHDAEDVMAAAFLELWRRRAKVRVVQGSILPWLLVTTTNMARNNGRAALRYRKLLDSLPRTEASSQHLEADLFTAHQESLDQDFAQALETLSAKDLHLVSLVVFEDYPLAAAAAVLNMTPGAAKTRMHRAKQRMKAALTGSTRSGAPAVCSQPTSVMEGERS
ncbi:sigma-70 family RNA polymerase sigma factor [Arthrobacter sp. FW306-05-C]|uniref:RNA polymerase sigma factor n=1 Tax=Arthrobacter sp. FW306-05-C TaxID=2879620 RepID=UPI001F20C1A5|nr:sigma-70 family RNA polymerase sigma factor [Arthrobacter sp. FW306-05-C]UKA68406.1 sigma-70 family RNA polymerase sigma factor [Arthrobacter sp. FW306-05-C]